MDLSGDETFEIITETHVLYDSFKPILDQMRQVVPVPIDNIEIAVLMDWTRKIFYYTVVYENSKNGNPDVIYLSNVTGRTLKLNCEMFCVSITDLGLTVMSGLSKWGHEGYLKDIGIKIPWIKNNVVNVSEHNEKKMKRKRKRKKRRRKHCEYCKINKSDTIELRLCARCKTVRYCSRRCQKKSWNRVHKHLCELLKIIVIF